MKKSTFIKMLLFLAILVLNTGCYYSLFGEDTEPKPSVPIATPVAVATPVVTAVQPVTTKIETITTNIPAPISTQATPSFDNIVPECTDDINAVNSCTKAPIKPTELQPKEIAPTGGEVHKLRSFQGQNITVVERSNGYLFPNLNNKVVILEMFGKNCSHCIKEMPILNRLKRRYGKNLEVVAIQVEGKMSKMQANGLIRRHHIKYPVISGETATNLQYHIQNTYGWTGVLPFIMVIKDGVTEFTYKGQVSHREINSDIKSLIN